MTTKGPAPNTDVIIIGAGLSGLVCANLLCDAGLKVLVLEASARIGGRIHSVYDPATTRAIADLGPTWVWPVYQPIISKWLTRLGVETFGQFEDGDAVLDFEDESPVRRQPLAGQHGISRIRGGPQALIEALAGRLPGGTIKTSQPVNSVRVQGDKVEVSTIVPPDQNPAIFNAAQVIVAIPLRLAAKTIDWSPSLDKSLLTGMETTPTWMATQAKAVIVYDTPFWRDAGLSGRVASQLGPMVEVHDHSPAEGGQGILFGFVGWPHEMRQAHPQQLRSEIDRQLVRCFGQIGGEYSALHIEDWAQNQWICSTLDLSNPPAHPEILPDNLRRARIKARLYFSVAEAAQQSPGLIEGAFAAAEETVDTLLNDIGEKPVDNHD